MTTEATQQEASQEQEVDLDAVFSEAAAKVAPEADGATTEQPDKEQETVAEGDLDLSDNATQEVASSTAASQPAKEVTTTKTTEEKPATDWRANLTADVKAEVDKLESERVRLAELNNKLNHTARSDAGRVAALTKRVEELSRVAKAAGSAEAQKRKALFEKFEADYPEIAAAMKAQAEEQEARITQAQTTAEELAKREAQKVLEERAKAVEDAHQGWKDTVKSPAFKDWLGQQPQGVRALGASDEPGDAITLLDAFRKVHPATSEASSQTETTTQASTAASSTAKPSKTAAEIKAQREKQLEASAGVATRGASRASTTDGGTDELEGAFNHYASRRK